MGNSAILPKARDIYESLKDIGMTRAQVRKILPAWWDAGTESHPDGVAELCLLVSRRLNLDLNALIKGTVQQKMGGLPVAYKHRVDTSPQSLQAATYIANSLARAVVAATPNPYQQHDNFASLAKATGHGIISLQSLVDACWSIGLPVIPMQNLPVGIRKMDGATLNVGNRPVIIISKKQSSRAWLAFILSHEIGHILCGHLHENGAIIDVALQEQATYEVESSSDRQEREADTFALSLLGGQAANDEISTWPPRASAADLAVRARTTAPALGIESGHLILRYAFQTKRWPEALVALRFLREDSDAASLLKTSMQRNLDLDLVSDDMRDLVCQLTGLDA